MPPQPIPLAELAVQRLAVHSASELEPKRRRGWQIQSVDRIGAPAAYHIDSGTGLSSPTERTTRRPH
jgi:hypothetical protein